MALAPALYAGSGAEDALRMCKNSASERLPGVPLAYISVNRGSDTNDGGYTIHFDAHPPSGPQSSGFCIISRYGKLQNLQFNPNPPGGGNRGGNARGISPQDAMRTCKNRAGERLPGVPLAYIAVYRGSDTGDGNYMINFHSQPPRGPESSGFCIISKNGRMQNFQFDPRQGGGGHSAGVSPQDAMRSCKNEVSSRRPNVPLAFINVDEARRTGGNSYMVNFRANPPSGPRSSGFCNVAQNGAVDVRFDR